MYRYNEDPDWNFEEEFIEGPDDDDDEDNEDPVVETKNTVRYVCCNLIGIMLLQYISQFLMEFIPNCLGQTNSFSLMKFTPISPLVTMFG